LRRVQGKVDVFQARFAQREIFHAGSAAEQRPDGGMRRFRIPHRGFRDPPVFFQPAFQAERVRQKPGVKRL